MSDAADQTPHPTSPPTDVIHPLDAAQGKAGVRTREGYRTGIEIYF